MVEHKYRPRGWAYPPLLVADGKVLMLVVGDPWEGVAVDPREMLDGSKNGRKD